MRFEFATAERIVFGPGTLHEAGPAAEAMGRRAFVVTDPDPMRAAPLLEDLGRRGLGAERFVVAKEPTTGLVLEGVASAREFAADLVVALGGGSVLDAGKAIAALVTNPGELLDYLEVIGRAQPLMYPPAPCIAIPTTAGTGAEVTRNAVLASPEHRVKVSLRHPGLLPRLAVVDPELTWSMPPEITASTGLDALTQLIEPFVSIAANAMTDGLCREGMARAARSLRRACENGRDASAREDMALASLFGGLALANARLGAVHGFAGPLGGMFAAPHGAVCARLLPYVMEANFRALDARAPNSPARGRYDEVARILTGKPAARAADGAAWVSDLGEALRIPPLSRYGLCADDIPVLVEKAKVSSSMKGNPIALTDAELEAILKSAL